jgi:hypothetical protein
MAHNNFGSDWTGALAFLKEKAKVVNDYVDRHDVYGDLSAINDEYTPAFMREQVENLLQTVDEQISYWAGQEEKKAPADPPPAPNPAPFSSTLEKKK